MKLFSYFRSSASFRVRIALNLKKLSADYYYVDLSKNQQFDPDFKKCNSQSMVPILIDNDVVISQSLAIIEYLQERYRENSLLPSAAILKAKIREFSYAIACEMQPFGNIRPSNYLREKHSFSKEELLSWNQFWIEQGLTALEDKLSVLNGRVKYCFTDSPSMADVCLIPQLINAQRFNCNLKPYKRLMSVYDACIQLEAFSAAFPSQQRDYIP